MLGFGVQISVAVADQRCPLALKVCWKQVEKSPKPVASCAMPAGPGMNIKTDTPLVKKAREGVMEFLLVSFSSKLIFGSSSSLPGRNVTGKMKSG